MTSISIAGPRHLALIDYVMIAGYFAVTLAVGAACVRRRKLSSGDFFLGGGRVAWWALALSMFAAGTSSISFMALPAKSYHTDWLAFGSVPAQSCAALVVGFLFVPLLRRLNLTTVFGYLDRRFDRRVRLLGAALSVLLKIGGRMSIVMLLPALALSTVTGMNVYLSLVLIGGVTTIYAMEGGFESVVWTDVLQATVTLGSLVISLIYLVRGVPEGAKGIIAMARHAGKLHAIDAHLSLSHPTVLVFVGMFFGSIFTQLGDQPNMQRWFAVKNDREVRRTLWLSTGVGIVGAILFFTIGTALFAFYQTHPDRLDSGLSSDAIFPFFIVSELPRGVVGLIVAGLFASAMGSLSTILNSAAAIVVSDFQRLLTPDADEVSRVRLARRTTLICGVLATAMAGYLAYQNVLSLWDEFLKLVALLGGGFPGVFALGVLSRRANATGALIGAFASIAVTWFVQEFTTTDVFFHGFVAVVSCMIIGYFASFITGTTRPRAEINGLVLWDLF